MIIKAKPFVKWAGGKKQLIPDLLQHKPNLYNRYLEPFVGGGAFLFELEPNIAIINDSNNELMNCYEIIRNHPDDLIIDLKKHKNNQEYFKEIRNKKPSNLSDIERASRFIYLNKTCYNGLWRVNKKGEFNTPFGRYKNPRIVNENLIKAVSIFLKNVEIYCLDFEEFLNKTAERDDFIYLYPPYHPISKYSDFKRYTKKFFNFEDQKRLANIFKKLDDKGCKLLLSNSYSEKISDLYTDYKIETVYAKRFINKDPKGRGKIKEVLIYNYG